MSPRRAGGPALAGLPRLGQRGAFLSLMPYLWPKGETGLRVRVVLAVRKRRARAVRP